jgi:hypothetical protein
MTQKADKKSDNLGLIVAPLFLVGVALLAGCESRVISAKGIGSERYETQPTFEQQYSPWLYETRKTDDKEAEGSSR